MKKSRCHTLRILDDRDQDVLRSCFLHMKQFRLTDTVFQDKGSSWRIAFTGCQTYSALRSDELVDQTFQLLFFHAGSHKDLGCCSLLFLQKSQQKMFGTDIAVSSPSGRFCGKLQGIGCFFRKLLHQNFLLLVVISVKNLIHHIVDLLPRDILASAFCQQNP